MTTSLIDRARHWRSFTPTMPSSTALAYARAERDYAAVRERLGHWDFAYGDYGSFASAELLDPPAYTIRVSVGDDDFGVDWGDLEPSDAERENAAAYFIAVQVLDENGDEVYGESIGGVDVIDLPGYLQRDWEDAVDYALHEYLLEPTLEWIANEVAERAEWAARDTVTV